MSQSHHQLNSGTPGSKPSGGGGGQRGNDSKGEKTTPLFSLQAAVQVSQVLSQASKYIKPIGHCVWMEVACQLARSSDFCYDTIAQYDGSYETYNIPEIVRKWDQVFRRFWRVVGDGISSAWTIDTGLGVGSHEPYKGKDSLTFALPDGNALVTSFLRNEFADVFDRLWEVADESPFGDMATHTTRVDESVRKGRELLAGKHWTINPEFVRQLARDWSLPPRKVRVVPYKLNMYRAGGGFAWHADTPETDLVGTILVGLLEDEKEGGFEIKHGSRQTRWPATRNDRDIYRYQYYPEGTQQFTRPSSIAFYADCSHKVEVRTGRRATLAFKVYARKSGRQPSATPPRSSPSSSASASASASAAESASASASASSSSPAPTSVVGGGGSGCGATTGPLPATMLVPSIIKHQVADLFTFILKKENGLGIVLSHAYNLHASALKGADAILFQLLQQINGVELHIIPVAIHNEFEGSWDEGGTPESVNVSVYPMTDADLAHAFAQTNSKKVIRSDQFEHLSNIPFFFGRCCHANEGGLKIKSSYVPFAAHTGNESQAESADSVYLYRAVIVTKTPDWVDPESSSASNSQDEDEE